MSERQAKSIARNICKRFASGTDCEVEDLRDMFSGRRDGFRVADYDNEWGEEILSCDVERSGLSGSAYVEIILETEDGHRKWKIRVSNHDSRPTYERSNPSDYHVGNYQDADSTEWRDAVDWAIRKIESVLQTA